MPHIVKLTVDGIPFQIVNFAKAYSRLVGLDEEEFWRREIAGVIDGVLQLLEEHNVEHIRKSWILNEGIRELKTPRSELGKRIDRVAALEEQEKKRK